MFNKKYLRNQEKLKTRDLYRIFKRQKNELANLLESSNKSFQTKTTHDELQSYLDSINQEDVEYLLTVLPRIMTQGAKPEIAKYKDLLPEGYTLSFKLPTDPASIYLRELEKLHLSEKDGSISKTTNDEVRKLIADGLDAGMSNNAIAKQIREVDPFVFSKSRAELISVQELGQAY
jgi:hypothetical protein